MKDGNHFMSTLYLSTHVEPLAQRLARHLDLLARTGDFFEPTTIVVPHRAVGQWLRLWLARQRGIAMNLRILFLEASLWEMLRAVDPRPQDPAPELLDGDSYRLLVLSVLAKESRDAGLEYWQRLLQAGAADARLQGRRLWRLADQLASLIRDYEYHRQDALIQHWLLGELGLDASHKDLELGQQAIFRAITRIPDGLRAKLNEATGRNFKTLPQYAMEVMELGVDRTRARNAAHGVCGLHSLHLFGLTQISHLHAKTLHWLGRFFDIRVYHFNALAGRVGDRPDPTRMVQLAQEIRQGSGSRGSNELLLAWGRAGAESLETMAELCTEPKGFAIESIGGNNEDGDKLPLFGTGRSDTVLARLQIHLTGVTTHYSPLTTHSLDQDCSLQILGCPGMVREVETVYDSILANLHDQPDLKQSDVAVLTTDMELYRPVLQAVFERRERRLHYNLGDFSAAGVSIFGQALVGMLDLALDAFTRSRVLAVLLNPCFLNRLGVERAQALVWLDWVEALGIYQSWDQGDKKERGYADSPLFAWQLGLRRLRLGRIMETSRDEQTEPAQRFGPVIPYADLHSSDSEQLNSFCLAVDGLLPRLAKLRHLQGSANMWVAEIEALMRDFLEIPPERPEETQVRDRLLSAMQQWLLCDSVVEAASFDNPTSKLAALTTTFTLPLIREMVFTSLEGIAGMRGQYSIGGVTIAALQPLKPMPFRIVYILGLGEDIFPGSNVLSGLDLRGLKSLPGDIRPAESNRNLFLETLLAVREKVYLTYNNLDIQKDQILHPAVPLQQLKRYLSEHILDRDFEETKIPLLANDESYLQNSPPTASDALVRFDECDRLLALVSAERDGGLVLSPGQQTELQSRLRRRQTTFSLAGACSTDPAINGRYARNRPTTVRLHDLSRYLEFPVPPGARFHLGLRDSEQEELAEDEPFISDHATATNLIRQTLNWFVQSSVQFGVDRTMGEWRQRFESLYHEWSLRGLVPEEAFGEVDKATLLRDLEARLGSLAKFLEPRQQVPNCGPILLGESIEPIGARQRFPALTVPLIRGLPRQPQGEARLIGSILQAWRSDTSVDVLIWCLQNQAADKELMRYLFEPGLMYLALTAGRSHNDDWLGKREFVMHVAQANRVDRFSYPPGYVSPEEARHYLAELTTDYLDPKCLDLLPLSKIVGRQELYRAICQPDDQLGSLAEEFRTLLEEHLAEDAENGSIWNRWSTPLVELVGPRVPDDAFAKIRRRFWLFHFFDSGT
jgi:exonuclease V gamma subunit